MAVDIYGAFASPGGIVAASPGIVANKRNDNAGIASLVFDVLHVGTIGEVVNANSTAVLILGLEEDDGSTICDLTLGNCGTDIFHVA